MIETAADIRAFAARLEKRSEEADAAGNHELAARLHRNARLHRSDARALEEANQ